MNTLRNKKMIKRKNLKTRVFAGIMTLVLCFQLVWCNPLEAKALDVTDNYDITENMGTNERINFSPTSSYAVLYVGPDVTVESYISVSNTSGATCEIENHGTITGPIVVSADVAWVHNAEDGASISTVQAESPNTDLSVYYGSFGIVDVTSITELTLSNCTIRSLSSNTKITVTGSNVTVTDSLTLSKGTTANINVYDTTTITVTNTPITVNCNGIEYSIPAGFSGTIADSYKSVTVTPGNGIELNTEGITGTYWFGDATGTNTYNVLPGYTFPANYTSSITSTGSGTLNASRVSGQELTISYTLAELETSDITIALPDATPLDPGTVSFTIPDIYVGQEVSYTFGTATEYDTAAGTVKFKKNTDGDEAYTTVKPTAVGDYTALVEFPATYDYGAYSQTYSFSIKELEEGIADITVADISYGETLNPQYSSSTNTSTPTVEYKLTTQDESAYTTTVPTAVGSYDARVTYPATVSHKKAVKTTSFNINYLPGEGSISVADVYVGTEITPVLVSDKNGIAHVIIEYKLTTDTVYSIVKPTAVGSYDVRATFPATLIYDEVIATDTFEIKELEEGIADITVTDISYGETLNPQYSSSTNTSTPTVEYKLTSQDESAYTTTVPTAVGSYDARVTYPATISHTQAVATTTFEINYLLGDGSISVNDVYVGTEITPVITSDKNGIAHAIIEYKLTSDTEYTTVKPTAVGSYDVRATFPATLIYDEVVATDTFKIKDFENGVASVTVKDVVMGLLVSPIIESSTNKSGNVTILYKVASADDTTYTSTVPTQVGTYTVKAIFEAYNIYKEVIVTDDFTISYLDVPEDAYTISGTMGENDIYTSEVTVTAKEGYLISDTLGGRYEEKLVFDATTDDGVIYLKKIETGEMTAGIVLQGFEVDTDAPIINLTDNQVYYSDSMDVALSDSDIVRVMVNDTIITAQELNSLGNKLTLDSEGGVTQYTIHIWDKAGNMSVKTVTVASEWTKAGVIPAGDLVKLVANQAYTFAEGNWQVEGDSTSYSGNTTFYVSEDGNYTFTQE